MLGDHVRTATTRAVTAVNLLAVDREAFEALFSTLPPLRMFFERLIEERTAPPGEDNGARAVGMSSPAVAGPMAAARDRT